MDSNHFGENLRNNYPYDVLKNLSLSLYLDNRLLNMIYLCYLVPYSRLDPYAGRSDYRTVPYRQGNSTSSIWLTYGTARSRILTVRSTAVAVYGTLDSPSIL